MASRETSAGNIERIIILGLISLSVVGGLTALRFSLMHRVEIRGTLSPGDVAEISRLHRSVCPIAWPRVYPKRFPVSVRSYLSGALSPIEVIAVPEEGR